MNIIMSDPHQGRCLNHRRVGVETVRCLEYEDVEHVCRFPEPEVATSTCVAWYLTPQPKPWVRPEPVQR